MTFTKELEALINKYNMETYSDTPDFILATFLNNCLASYNHALQCRQRWYGVDMSSESTVLKARKGGK